ncbi:hypothetical protein ACIHFD_60835 [Nonomuraea sp. NPDC051941]|uniref:hypothetical protein n=1 Tax=Nonomuraea sp. NPDC051941 TaxID=3364373 RepID=UPI0037C71046
METPSTLWAIGSWYIEFTQNTDEQVIELLQRAAPPTAEGTVCRIRSRRTAA